MKRQYHSPHSHVVCLSANPLLAAVSFNDDTNKGVTIFVDSDATEEAM